MVRAIETYGPRLVRYSGVSGLVGSQGRSQSALRTRDSRHVGGVPYPERAKAHRAVEKAARSGSPASRACVPRSIIPWHGPPRHSVNQRIRTRIYCGRQARKPPGRPAASAGPRVVAAPYWSTACPSTRASTAMPSRTPPVEPGRLTISVCPAGRRAPRDRTAVGTFSRAVLPDGLGDAGNLPVEHPPGHLGGEVGRGQPGAAGGDDHVVPGHRGPQRRLDRLAIGDHPRPVHLAPGLRAAARPAPARSCRRRPRRRPGWRP